MLKNRILIHTWLVMCMPVAMNFQQTAICNDGPSNLILEKNACFPKGAPIFDCACLDRKIVRAWFPPKDGNSHIQVAFKTGRDGQTIGPHLVRSSGIPACDKAAFDAIQEKKFFYIPTGEAEIIFDFSLSNFAPIGSSIMLPAGHPPPPLLFVKTEFGPLHQADCYSYTDLNNKGVINLIDGDLAAAKTALEQAHKLHPAYAPATHNLLYLESKMSNRIAK